jgi:hypothetical protein
MKRTNVFVLILQEKSMIRKDFSKKISLGQSLEKCLQEEDSKLKQNIL